MEQLKAAAMARTRRLRTRTPAASAFRGFLDDPTEPEASFQEQAQVTNRAETPVTQAQAEPMDVDDSLLMEEDTTVFKSPRKRPLPPELESDEIVNAKLYPAQAAAKRRRLEAGESLEQVTDTALEEGQIEKINKTKTSKVRAEANYEERMKAIREKQEEVNDDELEPMHQQLEKMSFEEKQKLIRIAEFEIKPRERDLNNPQTQDRRWKDEWNGRKNFKGFQKRGQPNMARNGPKIIIALEPIKVQSATEEYLATKQTEAERRKAKRMEGEEEGESEASQDFTDANSHLGEPPVELLGDGGPEIIDVDAPRTTRASDRGSQAPSRTRTTATSVKRQASTTTKGPSKKRKKLNLNMGDEDASSEEDEIPKFRFKQK